MAPSSASKVRRFLYMLSCYVKAPYLESREYSKTHLPSSNHSSMKHQCCILTCSKVEFSI
ncbi:hypothetical protein Bca52824_052259 [Brassica carinata]|uniref:Uncharacterized protein n=1 Tax=Brassica carinata TaxID=52824 RepID=A0A8X7UJP5_BRACI|nr:hypothetical protein Bca52824_052259 [Brassica carinata]